MEQDTVTMQDLAWFIGHTMASEEVIRSVLFTHPEEIERVLSTLVRNESDTVRREIAGSPHAPIGILIILSKDEDVNVQAAAREALSHQAV